MVYSFASIKVRIRKVPLVFFQTPLPFEFTKHTIATLEDQKGSRVILDFVPADRSITIGGAISTVLLLVNQHQPGRMRQVKMRTTNVPSEELDKLVDDIVGNWDENINIYSHNCQDFTRYVQQRVEACQHAQEVNDHHSVVPTPLRKNNDAGSDDDEYIPVSNETRQSISYIYDVVVSILFIGVAAQLVNGT